MKKIVLGLVIGSSLGFTNFDLYKDTVSDTKQKIFNQTSDYYDVLSAQQKSTLVGDINFIISGSDTEGVETKGYSVGLSQPVFRSGNIWNTIKLADKNNNINHQLLDKDKDQIVYTIIQQVLLIEQFFLSKKRIDASLEANEIELKKKQQLYQSGLLDITFVSDMIIQKNSLKNQKIEIENNIQSVKDELSNLSKLSYTNLIQNQTLMGIVKMVDYDDFKKRNYLSIDKQKLQVANLNTKMQRLEMYPSVVWNVSAYESTTGNTPTIKAASTSLQLKMPLSFSKYKAYETARVEELKKVSEYEDKAVAEEVFYNKKVNEINTIKQKITNLTETIAEYDKLITILEQDLKLGLGVPTDLELLKINKSLKELQKMEEINIIKQKIVEVLSHTKLVG